MNRALHIVATSWAVPMHVLPIAHALAEDGWEVDIACPTGPEVEGLDAPRIRHRPVPFSRSPLSPRHLGSLRAISRLLAERPYTVVHTHGVYPSTLGRIAAARAGVPVIYHCRGTFFDQRSRSLADRVLSSVYRMVERRLAAATTVAFTLNSADADDLVRCGVPPERITCLGVGGCGLDTGIWSLNRFSADDRAETRRRLGIPAEAHVIGFVGRLIREKGILELLEAFERLRAEGHPVHLLLIGGTLESERDQRTRRLLSQRITEGPLAPHVTSTGHVDTPAEYVSAMDVLVLPSYREGFGQVLVEAGALGKPVVATATRGALEAVLPGRTGLLVPKQDAASLTRAIRTLIERPELARELGERAATRAVDELSRERVLDRILRTYRSIGDAASGRQGLQVT